MSSPAETASPTSNGGIGASTAQGDDEKPRDTTRDPTDATTITGSANPDASTPAPSTKFEPNTPSKASKEQEPTVLNSSFDAHTPPSSKKPSPRKKSIWSSLLAKLVPCLSSKAHTIVIDDARPPRDSLSTDSAHAKVPSELQPTAQKDSISQAVISEKLAPSTPTRSSSAPPLDTDLPLPLPITEVVVPPSPKTHLLPPSETAGVTSGAVQAPGSTGREEEEDSQGASSDEEDGEHNGTSGEGTVPDDDDEDRLILQGGIGIPIVDGVPRPLLPPVAPEHRGRKCLVLDLDETLLHSSFKLIPQCDYVVPVEIEWQWHNVYVIKRPGVDAFLKKMGELFEIVVFTASLSKYADPVLDKLDIHKVVSHRLFRESCYNHKGNYVKDLSQLGRPMTDTIILDNSPASYIFHPNNAVPVSSWFNDPHDTELTDLCPFLTDLRLVDDIRGVLDGGL